MQKGGDKMKKLIRVVLAIALFVSVAAPLQPAYANGGAHPGWGFGDHKHVHTGPPGQSVKNETNINISNVFNIVAEAGANVTIVVYQTVNNFFGFHG